MPRTRKEAYTITYAVLGFLRRWGPMSGYDLKRWFDRGMGNVWEATHSQIYNELRRLQGYGWAEMEHEEQELRPDRKVYRITEAGEKALSAWLGLPADVPHIHDELILKLLLGGFASGDDLLGILERAAAEHEARLTAMREEVASHGSAADAALWQQPIEPDNPRDPYIALAAEMGARFEESYLGWLRDAIALIRQHRTEDNKRLQ
jgi:PadR family transcriptional regulator AphA